jgi:hypothetical protein
MERAMGIEPTSEAWEAAVLQLYDARSESYANKPARLLKKFFKIEGFAPHLPSGLVTASTYFSRPSP